MTIVLRRLFLIAMPLALAVALWWHPAGGGDVYEGLRNDVGAWLFVHTTLLLFMPLLGIVVGISCPCRGCCIRWALGWGYATKGCKARPRAISADLEPMLGRQG